MIVLDTNVVSETMRAVPSSVVLDWLSRQQPEQLYSSTITLAEILYGIELLPDGKRRYELLAGAERMFATVLAGRVLTFDDRSARAFAKIGSGRRRVGRQMAEMDLQIAAIAYVHGAALATRNMADFESCGIRLVNPWVD